MTLRIVVLGGGGFIGAPLVGRLRALGHDVRSVGLAEADVRDARATRSACEDRDAIVNLAAAHGLNTHSPAVYDAVNVMGAKNVCAAADAAGIRRLIFTSSADVYGTGPVFDESSATRPAGDYGRSKLAAEQVYGAWAAASGARLAIVRPTVVFGPGDRGAVARYLRHALDPDFAHFGESDNRRSLAFVENVAAFLAWLVESDACGTFNYADTPDLTIGEIVRTAREAVGLAPAARRSAPAAWLGAVRASLGIGAGHGVRAMLAQRGLERRLDASRAHAQPGFHAPMSLPAALAATARADFGALRLVAKARA